ncbi:MAG: (deoxy)nucleoside triphosphate pyrophosphohydrolase [Desulfuromonas sp.]|nr:MAG: (deoxy)nucleoside triphosphate pyrophosphohydrolase [Desulfuromonas sp.]
MAPLIVTAAIIYRNGEILITRRPEGSRHAGWWEFPGGKLHEGESPEEGLQREILEELSLPIRVGRIFDVIHHTYDFGSVLLLFYLCQPLADAVKNIGVAEHAWVSPSALDQYRLLPADRPLVERLRNTKINQSGPMNRINQ